MLSTEIIKRLIFYLIIRLKSLIRSISFTLELRLIHNLKKIINEYLHHTRLKYILYIIRFQIPIHENINIKHNFFVFVEFYFFFIIILLLLLFFKYVWTNTMHISLDNHETLKMRNNQESKSSYQIIGIEYMDASSNFFATWFLSVVFTNNENEQRLSNQYFFYKGRLLFTLIMIFCLTKHDYVYGKINIKACYT